MAFSSPSNFSTVSSAEEEEDVVSVSSNSFTKVPSEIQGTSSFNLHYSKWCIDVTSMLPKSLITQQMEPRVIRMQSSTRESIEKLCKIPLIAGNVDELNNMAGLLVLEAQGVEKDSERGYEIHENEITLHSNVHPLVSLVDILDSGSGRARHRDLYRAVELYRRAIESSENIEAMKNLAYLLTIDVDGIEVNFPRALDLLERAYSNGSVPSITNLANLLAHGADGVPQDAVRAKMLYEEAIGIGDVNALNNLASLLVTGAPGVRQDPIRAASLYVRGILDYGSVLSIRNLATILNAYFHFDPNIVSQLHEITQQNNPQRFIELLVQELKKVDDPMLHQMMKSILRNSSNNAGLSWTDNMFSKELVLDGVHEEQLSTDNLRLSNISIECEGKEKPEDVQLMKYYQREFEETGSVQSILNMADLLKRGGKHVAQDVPQAILLYEKAIEKGGKQAVHLLADLLTTDSSGYEQCRARAAELYQTSIENGNVESMYKLSCILAQRWSDLSPDIIRAEDLYKKYVDCKKSEDGMCERTKSCSIIEGAVAASSRENIVKMMSLVKNGMEISSDDVRLIVENDIHNSLIYMESTSISLQLEKLGIFFELIDGNSDMAVEADPDVIIQFKTGPSQRTVIVDVTRLTPTGLSILSWILLPSPENIKAISNVMKSSRFNNCLVAAVTGTKFESNPPVKLVVPMGWIFWLGIPSSFVVAHGYMEDFAVCIGHPDTTKLTTLVPFLKRLQAGTIFFQKRKEFDPEPFDDSKTEFLFLDTDHQLIYIPDLIPKQEIVAINAGGEAFGFGVTIGGEIQKSIDYEEGQRAIARGSIHRFVDFNNFIGLPMKTQTWGQLLKRAEWLSKLLNARYMFPSGYNRGLLRALTGIDDQLTETRIFEKEDCLVKYRSLQKRGVRQKKRGDMITIIFPGTHGIRNKRLVFKESELCKVQDTLGPRDTYKIPEIHFETALEQCEQCNCNITNSVCALSDSPTYCEEECTSSVEGCEHCGSRCEMVKIYMG